MHTLLLLLQLLFFAAVMKLLSHTLDTFCRLRKLLLPTYTLLYSLHEHSPVLPLRALLVSARLYVDCVSCTDC
jgi:hypothetical protein